MDGRFIVDRGGGSKPFKIESIGCYPPASTLQDIRTVYDVTNFSTVTIGSWQQNGGTSYAYDENDNVLYTFSGESGNNVTIDVSQHSKLKLKISAYSTGVQWVNYQNITFS